jgi:hypothetical protein
MRSLFIYWRHLHDDVLDIEEQKDLFRHKPIDQLVELAKTLCKEDRPEHDPQEYRTVISETPEDCIKFYTGKRFARPPFQLIYTGTADDYSDFLISLNVMLRLINTSSEKLSFIISLYSDLKQVNGNVAAKFAVDIRNEILYSMK